MRLDVEEIKKSPELPKIIQEFTRLLEEEEKKRQEFYKTITEEVKAEFINGEIIFHSPAKNKHLIAVGNLFMALSFYVLKNDLGIVHSEKALVSLTRNDYEPDIAFWSKEKASKFQPDQMRFPAPDFIVEVLSENTEECDRGIKFEDYALHDVREYWIVDPETGFVEQYQLQGDKYDLLRRIDTGEIESIVIPGFRLPVKSIFDREANMEFMRKL